MTDSDPDVDSSTDTTSFRIDEGNHRRVAEWMNPPDSRILEVLRGTGNMTPLAVSREGVVPRVDIARKYAGLRLRELVRYGLVVHVDRGLYRITNKGIAYLDQEIDPAQLDKIDTYSDVEDEGRR